MANQDKSTDTLVRPITEWVDAVDATDITRAPEDFLVGYGAVVRSIGRLLETGDAGHAPALLTALAACEFVLAENPRFTEKAGLPPLQPLDARWLALVDDGSAEFRLAASLNALAPVGCAEDAADTHRVRPVRAHLEPIAYRFDPAASDLQATHVDWDFGAKGEVVWDKEPDVDGLNAIFARRLRLWDAGPEGFVDSRIPARGADVDAFLRGQTDEAALSRFAFELSLIDLWRLDHDPLAAGGAADAGRASIDPAWQLMRRCYSGDVPLNRDIHLLASRGDVQTALEFAAAHLRKHGRQAPDQPPETDIAGPRLAAAMIFDLG